MLYTWNLYNIVHQVYLNLKKNKENLHPTPPHPKEKNQNWQYSTTEEICPL